MASEKAASACPVCHADMDAGARYCGGCGAAIAATNSSEHHAQQGPNAIGREIAGRYRILAKLGEGGMGAVYRAEQISLKRQVALKVLRPELSAEPGLVRRFNAEAELAAKLNHPNTVTLYDFGQDADGALFIAMEFIAGRSLRQEVVRGGPLDLARIVNIGSQICASLADAHATGIVHRDLKPDNVMLSERGRKSDFVSVLDFGIAKLRDQEGDITKQPMTRAGDILGTPQYMAPEQIRGETVDARTDVYALGVMLYEMSTARLPFDGNSVMALLSKHLTDIPTAPASRRPELGISPALSQLVMDCLAKDPAQRPATMDRVEQSLAALVSGPRPAASIADQAPSSAAGLQSAPAGYAAPPPGIGTGPLASPGASVGAIAHAATAAPSAISPGSYPGGSTPPGSFPQGSMPQGSMPQGSMPPASMPPASMPPASMPPESMSIAAASGTGPGHREPRFAATAKGSRKGLWAFLVLLVLGAGAAGAYFAFLDTGSSEDEPESRSAQDSDSFNMNDWEDDVGAAKDEDEDEDEQGKEAAPPIDPPAGIQNIQKAQEQLEELQRLGSTDEDMEDLLSALSANAGEASGEQVYVDAAFGYRLKMPAGFIGGGDSLGNASFTGLIAGNQVIIIASAWSEAGKFSERQIERALKRRLSTLHLKTTNSSWEGQGSQRQLRGTLRATLDDQEGDFLLKRKGSVFFFLAVGGPGEAYRNTRAFRLAFFDSGFETR